MSKDKDWIENAEGDEHFEQLMQGVGKRPVVPEGVRERAELQFRQELARVSAEKKRVKRLVQYAIAATVVLSLAFLLNVLREPYSEPVVIAVIAESIGEGYWQNNGTKRDLASGNRLSVGDIFSTANGYARLSLFNDSLDLRVGRHTRFSFQTKESIYLDQGTVYIDANSGNLNRFSVNTQFGIVEHTGTQYMVTSKPNEISIAVREGEVRYEGSAGIVLSHASINEAELIKITRSGLHSRHTISTSGEQWQWVNNLTPEFSTDGKSLMVILNWAARESGRRIVASDKVRSLAHTGHLTGNYTTGDLDEFIVNVVDLYGGLIVSELSSDIIRLDQVKSETPD